MTKVFTAYEAGRDSVINKPNTDNCSINFFATSKLRDQWHKGRDDAMNERTKQENKSYGTN
jgi:hypothetical protein